MQTPPWLTPLVCLAVIAAPVRAGTLVVGKDAGTIQATIDLALDGDTVVIPKGTYPEAVALVGRSGLFLRAQGKAVLQPPPPAVEASSGEQPQALLTITGGADIRVRGLQIEGGSPHNLLATDSPRLLLDRLRVSGSAGDALRLLRCQDPTVRRCRVDGAGANGIVLDDLSGGLVDRNRVEAAGDDGIDLSVSESFQTDFTVVTRNVLIDCADDGIDLNGLSNIIERNTVRGSLEDGIEVDGDTDGSLNLITRNTIKDVADNGIVLGGHENTALRNTIKRPGLDGVLLAGGGGHLVELTKVQSPGRDGYAIPTAGNLLLTNKVDKAGDDGFELLGTDNELRQNKASKSADFGLVDLIGGNTYSENDFGLVEQD